MRIDRTLGNNITLLLRQRGIKVPEFARALGYSVEEVQRLRDARLYTTKDDIHDIAGYFGISEEELYIPREEEYIGEGFLHCIGNFKDERNKKKILDIFDMYADLKEIVLISK